MKTKIFDMKSYFRCAQQLIRHFRRKNSESEDFALDALQNEIHKEKVKKKGGGTENQWVLRPL